MTSIAGFDGSKIESKQIYLDPKICLGWLFHITYIKPALICKSLLDFWSTGQFFIQKVVPQASGESSKVKVKVRVNIHGIFSVSSASLVEVQKTDETEEPMETEQVNEKDEQVWPDKSFSTVEKQEDCTCTDVVFTLGRICSSEQDADWSGWATDSGRQPKRTWRKATWEWRNGGKKFCFVQY